MGLRYVVSVDKKEYDNFKSIQTLQNIEWNSVDVLIFNSSKDIDVETILSLSKAGKEVPKIIYINKTLNSLFYGLFSGLNADIYTDESILDDESILEYLVSDYHHTGMNVTSVNEDLNKISSFVATVSKESVESLDKLLRNQIYVQTLDNSIKNVEDSLIRVDEANINMANVFNATSEIINTLRETQDKTTAEIEKLNQYLKEVEKTKPNSTGGEIILFPSYTVSNIVKKVLYIRVLSPCVFLNSFIGAYQDYLKMTKQKKVKVLLAVPKLKQYISKYGNMPRLATETLATRGLEKNDIFVTFEPKSQVLDAFFEFQADLHIVIDMMFGDNLIKGASVISLNAVSWLSDVKKFNIDGKHCIVPIQGASVSILIPRITGYSFTKVGNKTQATSSSVKRNLYFEACKDSAYAKLDKLLGYQDM